MQNTEHALQDLSGEQYSKEAVSEAVCVWRVKQKGEAILNGKLRYYRKFPECCGAEKSWKKKHHAPETLKQTKSTHRSPLHVNPAAQSTALSQIHTNWRCSYHLSCLLHLLRRFGTQVALGIRRWVPGWFDTKQPLDLCWICPKKDNKKRTNFAYHALTLYTRRTVNSANDMPWLPSPPYGHSCSISQVLLPSFALSRALL